MKLVFGQILLRFWVDESAVVRHQIGEMLSPLSLDAHRRQRTRSLKRIFNQDVNVWGTEKVNRAS